MNKIKIGTRGSKLAIHQAQKVKNLLIDTNPDLNSEDFEIVIIKTKGDIIKDAPLIDLGGKSVFTKDIEKQLIAKNIDIAVHSLKDFTSNISQDLIIKSFLKRDDYRDAIVSKKVSSISELNKNLIIGTSSTRRKAQLLHYNHDLNIVNLRGNIDSRIANVENGKLDVIILSKSGIDRLKIAESFSYAVDIENMLPAPGQGVICVEIRENDKYMNNICEKINHKKTEILVNTERAVLEAMNADCSVAMAALAEFLDNDNIILKAEVFSKKDNKKYSFEDKASIKDANLLGYEFGIKMKDYL